MLFLKQINKTKSDFDLFINRKQLKKVNFVHKCHSIISDKMSFQDALIQLPEFLQVVEVIHGRNKIVIDNKFGKFIAVWDNEGKNLVDYEFKTRRDVF